jgi:hypothetical protein
MIRLVSTCLSVLLASAPIVPVYAGKQSTASTDSEIQPATNGQTPSTDSGQGGTQNTPSTPSTPSAPNTNTATPPQVVNQMAQQRMSPGAIVGIGAAGLLGVGVVAAVAKGIHERQYLKDIYTVSEHFGHDAARSILLSHTDLGFAVVKQAIAVPAQQIREYIKIHGNLHPDAQIFFNRLEKKMPELKIP